MISNSLTAPIGGSTLPTTSLVTGIDTTNSLTTNLILAADFTVRGGSSGRDWTDNRYDFVPNFTMTSPTEKPDHGSHQGYTFDPDTGKHIVFDTTKITRHNDDGTWTVDTANASPFAGLSGSPAPNHIGDGQYYNGLIYVPVLQYSSCSSYANQKIVTYNATTLAYVAEYDISAQPQDCAGIGIDSTNGIIYVGSFCDGTVLSMYSLSAPATFLGYLTLDVPIQSSGTQSVYYRESDGLFYIGNSSKGVAVYNTSGELQRYYTHTEPGDPQGIDFSQSELRQTIDNGVGDRRVHFFDISAEPADQAFTGYSLRINKNRNKQFVSHFQIPEQGTLMTRIKPVTAYNFNAVIDQVGNADDLELWYNASNVLSARANNVTLSFGSVDVGRWYDVAYTWNDNGVNTLSEVFLNSISIASDATAPIFSPGNYLYLGGGHPNNTTGDIHYQYFFVFDSVLSETNIGSIHSDPYTLFTTS